MTSITEVLTSLSLSEKQLKDIIFHGTEAEKKFWGKNFSGTEKDFKAGSVTVSGIMAIKETIKKGKAKPAAEEKPVKPAEKTVKQQTKTEKPAVLPVKSEKPEKTEKVPAKPAEKTVSKVETTEKPKRKRRTKAEMEAARVQVTEKAPTKETYRAEKMRNKKGNITIGDAKALFSEFPTISAMELRALVKEKKLLSQDDLMLLDDNGIMEAISRDYIAVEQNGGIVLYKKSSLKALL